MNGRRPTIIDVANRAGVSKSTVSLVIRQSEAVREETRIQVNEAIAALGYVYNRAAAQMRSGDGGLIGVIINDLRNPFFSEFAASFQAALADSGYLVMLANSDEDAAQQAKLIKAMIQHNVSALVISPAYGDLQGSFDDLIAAKIPTIQVMRQVDHRVDHFPFIAPDYFEGGRQATEYLINQGARNIAFVGGLVNRPVTAERASGYLSVLAEHGLASKLLHGRSDRQFGIEMARCLLIEEPDLDAVVCFNDFVALGFASQLTELNIKNVHVVGFDDIDESKFSVPPISTVQCNISNLARTAANALLDFLQNGRSDLKSERSSVVFVPRGL